LGDALVEGRQGIKYRVFGDVKVSGTEEVLTNWEEIKKKEKEGKEDANLYLPEAFDEACELIDKARKRKGFA